MDAEPGDTVAVTPEGRYDANAIHRFLLGSNHREIWSTPMSVEVLDLDSFAGGLTPLRRGGGLQTRSLRFVGTDGVVYNFRSLDKDASRTLDPELRRSIAARVLQDQISALLPLSALVVAPLLEAGGVLHASPVLRIMPDDPRLGEFREEFAGLLGLLEERPDEGPDGTEGFGGSTRVTGSERLLERLEESPRHRVDAAEFLRARLLDVYVGDWDRHPDQWRWAEFPGEDGRSSWHPIPRDRDWALARLQGALVQAAGLLWYHYHGFGHDYNSAFRSTWSGRALDRRILPELTWAEWESVAADLQRRLTDRVIADAVRQLPESYYVQLGEDLESALRNRRDGLMDMAREFYDLLAGSVDLWATDEDERVAVRRHPDGRIDVEYSVDGASYLGRTFLPEETREVRLFLRGGEDRVRIEGAGPATIAVRIVGGGGDDAFVDETDGRGVHVYDDRGDNTYDLGGSAKLDDEDYDEPDDPGSATHQARPRDWGAYAVPIPYLSLDSDLGLFAGAGILRWTYGFRHFPYKSRLSASVGIGTASGKPRAVLDWDFPLSGPRVRGRLRARWSGAEVNRFYGRGNGSDAGDDPELSKAEREEVGVDAFLVAAPSPGVSVGIGPTVRYYDLFENPGRTVRTLLPYGAEQGFGIAGLGGELTVERRNVLTAASEGGYLRLSGRWFPSIWDAREAFGGVKAEAAVYRSLDAALSPTLAVRVGAEKVFGEAPYQQLAYLGGLTSLRGFPNDRFAGDGAVFANAELRLALGDLFFFLPGEFGVHGLADVGRVFDDADDVSDLHTSFGGGAWIAFVNRAGLISLTLANGSDGDLRVYTRAGFPF